MKPLRSLLLLGMLSGGCHAAEVDRSRLREGDILFQTSRSSQSLAIQLATTASLSDATCTTGVKSLNSSLALARKFGFVPALDANE